MLVAMNYSAIELLEVRIAPATIAGNILTYTDLDGHLDSRRLHFGSNLQKVTIGHATYLQAAMVALGDRVRRHRPRHSLQHALVVPLSVAHPPPR